MQIKAVDADTLFDLVIEQMYKTECRKEAENNGIARELINANLVLTDPTRNTMIYGKRRMSMRYAIAELLWYNSRNRHASSIERFSKFWLKLQNENGNVNSNYGYCIHDKYYFDQWWHTKELLSSNKGSRQAVIHIKEPRDLISNPTADVNCTIALQFIVNDGKLDLIVTMRSNDVWLGLPYDLFNFTCMQIQMAMELDLEIGTYYHNAASLHLYQKDEDKLKEVTSCKQTMNA